MSNLEDIFKMIYFVPEFNGNPNVLTRFLKVCDELIARFKTVETNELEKLALFNGILNKITGSAARALNIEGLPETWEEVRVILVNNFVDHRDETSLYNELALLNQGSLPLQEFHDQCLELYSSIMTYINLHEPEPSAIESKRKLYKKLVLHAFLRGLSDPLGSRIRCMRPETIELAMEQAREESNIIRLQKMNLCKKPDFGYSHGTHNIPINNIGHCFGAPSMQSAQPFAAASSRFGTGQALSSFGTGQAAGQTSLFGSVKPASASVAPPATGSGPPVSGTASSFQPLSWERLGIKSFDTIQSKDPFLSFANDQRSHNDRVEADSVSDKQN